MTEVYLTLPDIPSNPYRFVPFDRLSGVPRTELFPDDFVGLVESIREEGLVCPLFVTRDKDRPGHFEVLSGSRRLRAVRYLVTHDVVVFDHLNRYYAPASEVYRHGVLCRVLR